MNHGRGGIEYEDLKIGEGPIAERGCTVEVVYDLFLNRGEQVQSQQSYILRLGKRDVIAALDYGVEGMRVGGERRIRAGAHLAYRDQGVPGVIPANAVLVFHVTLLQIHSKPEAGVSWT